MQTIINEALKHAEREKYLKADSVGDDDDFLGQPRIVIVGLRGCG